ncbi:DUF58 domain-containing protein [Limnochorda pilosa]|uniref:DUF58 domain-containing protein n=1 Tax=Limnochorda pilosa TaxID=1555112 RepID=A0A0K2SPQ3_LIMPI|nr:DUF58 domain-containing protein [Limnochorda pilosa]BAS28982.1 hypothetical protein LIP_3155 [Limnochorda pilosa]
MAVTEQLIRQVERLRFLPSRALGARHPGERPSRHRGHGLEFVDYRPYGEGDELRYVDWNLAARLDRMYVKLFAAEESLRIVLLVDTSPSMALGRPAKLALARDLATLLGYLALFEGDRLYLGTLGGVRPGLLPVLSGRAAIPSLLAATGRLRVAPPSGLPLLEGLDVLLPSLPRRALVVVLSDLFADAPPEEVAGRFLRGGHAVVLLQVLAPDEVNPETSGALRLEDVEGQDRLEVWSDRRLLDGYRDAMAAWLVELRRASLRRGIRHHVVSSDRTLDEVLFHTLLPAGVVG